MLDADADEASQMFIDGELVFEELDELLPDDVRADLRAKLTHFSAEYVCLAWTRARDLGTEMHERIEFFLDAKLTRAQLLELAATNDAPELLQFIAWYDEWVVPRGLQVFRVELRVKDDDLEVCGSIDALFLDPQTDELIIVDWKRAKRIWHRGFNGAHCTGVLAGLADCNFIHYSLQQNMYRYIVQKNTSRRVREMHLLICHPNQTTYNFIPVEKMDDRVRSICDDYTRSKMA